MQENLEQKSKEELIKMLLEKNKTILEKNKTILEKNNKIQAKDRRINAYEYRLNSLNNELNKANNELNKVNGELESTNKELEKEKAKAKKLMDEIEDLKTKYENELALVKKNNLERFVGKSEKEEKLKLNEVEETLEKEEKEEKKQEKKKAKQRKSPKEQFVKELAKIVDDANRIEKDYDFEGNNVDRSKVKELDPDKSIKVEVKPLVMTVYEITKKKYKDKNKIYEPLSDDVFPHSVLTPSFAAFIITCKYELFMPLYRCSNYIKSRLNVDISDADLSNYVKRADEKLRPLYQELKKALLDNNVLHIDETTIKVIDEKDREKCYMFVYRTSHWTTHQIALYDFSVSRKTTQTKELLNDYKGYVVVDGYDGYDFFKEQGIEVQRCWVHIRRYFYDCIKVLPKDKVENSPVYPIFNNIQSLFKEEHDMTDQEKTLDEITAIRNSESYIKILDDIDDEVQKVKNKIENNEIKSESIKKAITYYTNIKNKGEARTFLKSGEITIDNNLAERTVKPFVIGRKNFLFCKTTNGGEISGRLYSIVQTAKLNGLNSENYIEYVLSNIDKINDINELLPWNENIQKKFTIMKDITSK